MQGDEIHEGTDDEGLGPHLTQQSAQVDHWALRENKAHEEIPSTGVLFNIQRNNECQEVT